MEALMNELTPDSRDAAKQYISKKEIPQLFESITAGMLHHRPENPVEFLQECLVKVSENKGNLKWNTFIEFTPSDKCRRPASRPASSKSKTDQASTTQSEENASSTHTTLTPGPISAQKNNRSRSSASDIQTFP